MDSECCCVLFYAGKEISASPNQADSVATGSPTRYEEGFGAIRLGSESVHGRRCPPDTGMVSGVQVPIRWDLSLLPLTTEPPGQRYGWRHVLSVSEET